MERNGTDDDFEETIVWPGPQSYSNANNSSQSSDIFEVDSVISHESSPDGLNYLEDNSDLSNESSHPTLPDDIFQQWLDYILGCRINPKQLADLNGAKTSHLLGNLVSFINLPNVAQTLMQYGILEYNNEMHGVFIQAATKEFKQSHGFDEANFPFEDSGGPQKGKLQHGYLYKYWVGKADKSYKMRKFYQENGIAIIVVFREPTSPSASPSSSAEIKVDKENTNKKPRVGESPFSSSEVSSHSSSPTRLTNAQPSSNGSNYNYSTTGSAAPTNYSLQSTPPNGTTNNTNAAPNPLHTTEHIVNRLDALDGRVDGLATRMTNLELTNGTQRTVTVTPLQRQLGTLILRVLRENGGRHQMGKPLATKVRKLFGASLETKVVNNLLYTVLEPLGIVRLQDKEWVLIDEEKAKEFEQQQ